MARQTDDDVLDSGPVNKRRRRQANGQSGHDSAAAGSGRGLRREREKLTQERIVDRNWRRYEYCKDRGGHYDFCIKADRNRRFYKGGGEQWDPDDAEHCRTVLKKEPIELNEIADGINTAMGYQINNRADIAFRPRGHGATDDVATTLSKVAMQIADNCKLRWIETDMFFSGLVTGRGFLEYRVSFDDSMQGEMALHLLDAMDVLPDPDAREYDPDTWADVTITRWMTLDEIEQRYGIEARESVEARNYDLTDRYGDDTMEVRRWSFDTESDYQDVSDAYDVDEMGVLRVRVIDRQAWEMTASRVVVFPTGDIRVADNATPDKLAAWRAAGCYIINRDVKKVRWTITTRDDVLFDDWSPFKHFTVVPFFPYFMAGSTKALVDDGIGPQVLLNKSATNMVDALGKASNSGWLIEEDSLTNMETDDLKAVGGMNGLILEYGKGLSKPEKIQASQVPAGIDRLMQYGSAKIAKTMGVTEGMRGDGAGAGASGNAVQSRQFGAQMSLAMPLDNLSRTRYMVACRILEVIQGFYDEERIIKIIKVNPLTGEDEVDTVEINKIAATGEVLNNVTVGEYDVVVTERPAQITFENSQYNQAIEMRNAGINVPDSFVIRYSTLENKAELIEQMGQQQSLSELDEAKALLARAQATAKNIEALFSAARTAELIATAPHLSSMADSVAKSAGFEDRDAAPIMPPIPSEVAAAGAAPPPVNTNPATPDNPERGMLAGSEAGPAPDSSSTGV